MRCNARLLGFLADAGVIMLHSIPLAWLAQLHVEHEPWSQARIVVEQAQAPVRRYDEYVWMPEIHGLEGCIWRAEGQHHRESEA